MPTCPTCAADVRSEARFCPTCGATLITGKSPLPPLAPPAASDQPIAAKTDSGPFAATTPTAPRRSNRGLIIGLLAAAAVILLAAVAIVVQSSDGDGDDLATASRDDAEDYKTDGLDQPEASRDKDGDTGRTATTVDVEPVPITMTTARPTTTMTDPILPSQTRQVFCVVDTTPLNLRNGPGTQHTILTAIPIDACDVLEAAPTPETAMSTAGQPWRRIEWQGTVGWVADWLIEAH